jgi:hypothetical protein
MTEEGSLLKQIMLKIGRFKNVRIFRNNTGMGWVGLIKKRYAKDGHTYLVLEDPRPLQSGLCLGSSDLIGFTSVTISPDMVGKTVAIFTALEVKTKTGRASKEQNAFIDTVKRFGGLAGIPRLPQDAETIVLYGEE